MSKLNSRLRLIGLCAGSAAIVPAASANHSAAISSPTQYVAEWSYVPDFDQRRALLPNTGRMYCVPTSALNWMTYIAHHGYPSVAPGDAPYWSWLQAENYNPMTGYIADMGTLMSTDENNGTNGSNSIFGMSVWLSGQNFILVNYWTHGNVTVRFTDIANATLNKVPTIGIVGWYAGEEPTITRNGGHALSVTKVARSGAARQIEWRDPADEQSILFSQSGFVSQSYACDPRVVFTKGAFRTMDKVVGYGSGYIDGMQLILPLNGLTTTDDSLKLKIHKPNKFIWDSSAITEILDVGIGGSIQEVKYIPGSLEVLILTDAAVGGIADVWRFNPLTMESTLLGPVPGATKMITGRGRDVYFLTADGGIMCYPLLEEGWDVEASVYPPDPIRAIAYDDVTDTVYALGEEGTRLYRYDKSLAGEPQIDLYPPDPVYIFDPDVTTSMAVSPLDGSVFITNEANDSILHVNGLAGPRAETTTFANGLLVNPRCVQVGDDGRVFVSSENAIREFRFNPDTGEWNESLESNMTGLAVGACLEIPHSRTNYDPEQMPLEEFRHELPTEFADPVIACKADLDGDLVIDGSDLAILLAGWGEPGDLTDLNGDGTTDGADLAELLAAWGDCVGAAP